jgi:hypothetical protein
VSAAGVAGIGRGMRRRPAALAATIAWLAAVAIVPAAPAATTRSCGSVRDPYPGTRYAGVDLTHITATGVSCRTARSVARGAHRKALGITPPVSGIRTFTWNGWNVGGDLRPAHDRYVATRGSTRVRWRF